jgi:hypothetical protein
MVERLGLVDGVVCGAVRRSAFGGDVAIVVPTRSRCAGRK